MSKLCENTKNAVESLLLLGIAIATDFKGKKAW
jgi:hypothetical protein